jgi:hypothetical protein
MKKVKDLKSTYEHVLASDLPSRIKREMLGGILSELKRIASASDSEFPALSTTLKLEQTATNDTSLSHLSLNSNDFSSNSNILPYSLVEGVSI